MDFGNMTPGYPFTIGDTAFYNSECAYICGAFSLNTDAHIAFQRQLVACDDGRKAKVEIHIPHIAERRADWLEFNLQWMLYVVWQKCTGNERFASMLLALPQDAVIIEDSTNQTSPSATFWGTRNTALWARVEAYKETLQAEGLDESEVKHRCNVMRLGEYSQTGEYKGCNALGKILMMCKQALHQGTVPTIDYPLLAARHIHLMGKDLFQEACGKPDVYDSAKSL